MHEIIVCDQASNSLAPGQNPACDLSGPTTITKALPGRPRGGKATTPTGDLVQASTLQSLKGAVVKDPGANDWPSS